MKTMHKLKYFLLAVPFNALAHPGHEATTLQAGANGLTTAICGIALALALVSGIVFFVNASFRRKDKISDG